MVVGETSIKMPIEKKDTSFSTDKTSEHQLHIEIGTTFLRCVVYDAKTERFLAYANYPVKPAHSSLELEKIIAKSELLSLQYDKVKILVDNPISTLVPAAIYSEENTAQYLELLHPEIETIAIHTDYLSICDAINVYELPETLTNSFFKAFPNATFKHVQSVFIETFIKAYKYKKGVFAGAVITENNLALSFYNEGKLIFVNNFKTESTEDILYYIIYASEQLDLNYRETEFLLFGENELIGSSISTLQSYLPALKKGTSTTVITIPASLEVLSSTNFHNLTNSPLCA